MATTNSSFSLKDSLMHFKKKLERITDEETIINIIRKLSKVPITLDLLQGTGVGKSLRVLSKKPGTIGHKASSLLTKWRCIVATSQMSSDHKKQKDVNLHSTENVDNKHKIKEKNNKHSDEGHSKVKYISLKPKHSKHKELKSEHSKDKHVKEKNINNYISHSDKLNISKTGNLHEIKSEKLHSQNFSNYLSDKTKFSSSCENNSSQFPEVLHNLSKSQKDSNHSKIDTSKFEPTPKKIKLETTSSHYSSSTSETIKSKHSSSNKYENITALQSQKKSSKHLKNVTKKDSEKSSNDKKTSTKVSDKQSLKSPKKLLKIQPTEAFTSSEATFEDCLSFNDFVPLKKKKISKSQSISSTTPRKVSKSQKPVEKVNFKNNLESPKKFLDNKIIHQEISEMSRSKSVLKNEVDIFSTLPQTQPNYRPLPHRNYDHSSGKKNVMSNEEAIQFTSSRKEKTAVYSGRRYGLTEVPTLFECATRVLIENIDDIEYMGEIPFYLLESMLKRCTAQQLFKIENYNPHLLEETNELWEVHCKRDYRSAKRQENETWRELYWRTYDEQALKLRNVTANISASIANSNPVRKAKLAYIDVVAKPPRDVARRQAKNGTGLPTNHAMKSGLPSKASPRPFAPAVNAAIAAATTNAVAIPSNRAWEIKPQKPKVAPLMAKTLKSMKKLFRR